ncbi:MAG TPA: Ig-like domain-containing protein [Kofleriaceae bacterium]|nr:Ig-like domain-containing protein [Kofleriaceae bacterium]
MRRTRLVVPAVAVALAFASSPAAAQVRPAHRCGTEQVTRSVQPPPPWLRAAGDQRVIYLNRNGATFNVSGGTTNAATNVVSTRVANGGGRTAVIPPLTADWDWPWVAQCVADAYKPYDLRVVETEPPADTIYIEAIVGGTGTELGYAANELFGIAAADNFCGVTEAGVAFTFSEVHRNVEQRDAELCATIAHEVGHLLALEHETLATDLLSYVLVADTTSKSFVNMNVACGVFPNQPTGCSCSASTTNSASRLGQFVGARPVETGVPTLRVRSPGDDDKVPPGFTVEATAGDDTEMADVLAYVDGVEVGHDATPDGDRYIIDTRAVPVGAHTLAVVARDRAGNLTRAELAINVALLDNGASCDAAEQCTGGLCATDSDGNFCTQTCTPGGSECGGDFSCEATSGGNLCIPVDGGCCSTSRDPRGALALIAMVGLLLGVRRRRGRPAAR